MFSIGRRERNWKEEVQLEGGNATEEGGSAIFNLFEFFYELFLVNRSFLRAKE